MNGPQVIPLGSQLEPERPRLVVPCPCCGADNTATEEDWQGSITPHRLRWGTLWRDHITCCECHVESPARDWHRAYERRVFALLGVVTPRAMRDAAVVS